MSKDRVDVLCVEKGLFDSREKAKRAIVEGIVYVDGLKISKPGLKIDSSSEITIVGEKLKYVSRGGLKLEKAINEFDLHLEGAVMLDIGSSTGGFSDCALQHGAKLVYALDVGTNQLADKLRNDKRVVVKEQTNFRNATLDMFESGQPDFASIDVSFISLKHIFKPLSEILKQDHYFVALIKPQFEAGKNDVSKNGIVSNKFTHIRVINDVITYAHDNGMSIVNLSYSPVKSDIGNIEFLGLFINKPNADLDVNVSNIVEKAHEDFKG